MSSSVTGQTCAFHVTGSVTTMPTAPMNQMNSTVVRHYLPLLRAAYSIS